MRGWYSLAAPMSRDTEIASFGSQIVVKWLEGIAAWKIGSWNFGSSLFPFVVPEAKIEEKLYQDPIFLTFQSSLGGMDADTDGPQPCHICQSRTAERS